MEGLMKEYKSEAAISEVPTYLVHRVASVISLIVKVSHKHYISCKIVIKLLLLGAKV